MERTEPVNPERRVNLLLKIWLYPNVSAFKIAKSIPSLSNYRQNYYARKGNIIMIVAFELFILKYGFHYITETNFTAIFLILLLTHGLPEFIFYNRINEMAFDYYAYYNKAFLFLFLIFMIAGFICFLLFFNSQIGHVQ